MRSGSAAGAQPILGWSTDQSTKPVLADDLAAAISQGVLLIRSREVIAEVMTFVVTETGERDAELGCYDDRVIALDIAWQCLSGVEADVGEVDYTEAGGVVRGGIIGVRATCPGYAIIAADSSRGRRSAGKVQGTMTAPEVVISGHARFEMERRQISEESVRRVVLAPEQTMPSGTGRTIRQSRIVEGGSGKTTLLRVVTEDRPGRILVVTAYRTSRVSKYWEPEGER